MTSDQNASFAATTTLESAHSSERLGFADLRGEADLLAQGDQNLPQPMSPVSRGRQLQGARRSGQAPLAQGERGAHMLPSTHRRR